MTVLVTGGAGYIGSHMVYALTDRGENVVVLDNLSTGFAWAVSPQAKLIKGDIGDAALVAEVIRRHDVTAIIHFAGSIIVPESVQNPLKYYDNNTCRTQVLLQQAVKGGVEHFIFSSTAAVYGIPERNPVSEDALPAPINPYGRSKLMTEWMLEDTTQAHGMSYMILRYFNVAGADPKGRTGQSTPEATHLIKVACQTALGMRDEMAVFGTDYPTPDGTCIRDYIHVSDLISAHMQALDYLRKGGQSDVFNCGYGHGFSVWEVIDMVREVAGRDFNVRIAGRRPGDPPVLVAEADRVRATLGWQPQYDDLRTIVQSAYEWERRLMERNREARATG